MNKNEKTTELSVLMKIQNDLGFRFLNAARNQLKILNKLSDNFYFIENAPFEPRFIVSYRISRGEYKILSPYLTEEGLFIYINAIIDFIRADTSSLYHILPKREKEVQK